MDLGAELGRVHTPGAFGSALKQRLAGRSSRNLEKALKDQHLADQRPASGGRPRRLSGVTAGKSVLSEVLSGQRLPKPDLLTALLRLMQATDQEHAAWHTALRRVAAPGHRGTQRVRDASPRLLGVHKAITIAGVTGDIPPYVPRDADLAPDARESGRPGLRALIAEAQREGRFVLLVGTSSVGKTRSAYEAVTALLPDWALIQPRTDGNDLTQLVAAPNPRTVLWLDEVQRYFTDSSGLTADTVRAILAGKEPILIIATMWPDRYERYTTPPPHDRADEPDLYRREREVLDLADVVRIEARWTDTEMARARQAAPDNPWIRFATEAGSGFSPPQILAAAPQVEARWHDADPYAAAVMVAAVDATRLGFQSPLPAEMLQAAAEGYCDGPVRATAQPDWFATALAYATTKLHGAVSALEPVAGPGMGTHTGYTVTDYLLQHTEPQRRRSPVPDSLWHAVLTHSRDRTDLERLGNHADQRGRRKIGTQFLRLRADSGDIIALSLLVERGDPHALDTLRELAPHNDQAATQLANRLVRDSGDGALDELRILADANQAAADLLPHLLARRSETDPAALTVLRTIAAAGNEQAYVVLTQVAIRRDDVDEITELRALSPHSDYAAGQFVRLLLARGNDAALSEVHALAAHNQAARQTLADLRRQPATTDQTSTRHQNIRFHRSSYAADVRGVTDPGDANATRSRSFAEVVGDLIALQLIRADTLAHVDPDDRDALLDAVIAELRPRTLRDSQARTTLAQLLLARGGRAAMGELISLAATHVPAALLLVEFYAGRVPPGGTTQLDGLRGEVVAGTPHAVAALFEAYAGDDQRYLQHLRIHGLDANGFPERACPDVEPN